MNISRTGAAGFVLLIGVLLAGLTWGAIGSVWTGEVEIGISDSFDTTSDFDRGEFYQTVAEDDMVRLLTADEIETDDDPYTDGGSE